MLLFDGINIIITELKNQSLFNSHKERYNRKKYLKKKAVEQIQKAKQFLLEHQEEFEKWRLQNVISISDRMGPRRALYAFIEQGIYMLSRVLKSDVAIDVNCYHENLYKT